MRHWTEPEPELLRLPRTTQVWLVRSSSRPELVHAVVLWPKGNRSGCTCEAGAHGRMCRHQRTVIHKLAERASA